MRFSLVYLLIFFFVSAFSQNESQDIEQNLKSIQKEIPLDFNLEVRQYVLDITQSNNAHEILRKFVTYDETLSNIFAEQEVPVELRYACISLSECENNQSLKGGKEGYYKMNYRVAKSHGLHISNYVDERRDVEKSAEAFCKEMKQIYNETQDWKSALTIYSCGAEKWHKARITSNSTNSDFWEISKYLSHEYRAEYPKYVAAVYLANYYSEYGITPNSLAIELGQVQVMEYTTLYQLSSKLDIEYQLLQELNPTYKRNIIPSSEKIYELTLPSSKIATFNSLGKDVYDYARIPTYTSTEVKVVDSKSGSGDEDNSLDEDDGSNEIFYSVRNGDILVSIADLFDCEVVQIQRWNNLKSQKLLINQQLMIKVLLERKTYYKKIDMMTNAERAVIRNQD